MGIGVVPVMTIHKSKGLEYHSVIFIGLEDGAFWSYETQPDEDKCAFFVALSRAKERVIFTFSKERMGRYKIEKQSISKIKELFNNLGGSQLVNFEEIP
jgi:superfamily I DNA/RNA helicase